MKHKIPEEPLLEKLALGNNAFVVPSWSNLMTDNANKPGDHRIDRSEHRSDKVSEKLSKGAPEVNNDNLRAAQKANPNRTDTVSPDGKSRFSLTNDGKSTDKQVRAAQEKAYKDAGLGDPHKPIGKLSESSFDPHKVSEQAAKALNKVLDSGKSAVSEGAKLWQGAHNGMHEAVNETVQSVSVAKDYYGNALAGKVNLSTDVKEFAGAISKGVSQSLGTAGDYYFRQVPKGEANLGKDIGTASKAASDHWNSLDTEQKGHFIGKEVVPLLVPGAVGVVAKEIQGANLIAKTGEAITAFSSSEKFAAIEQKMAQLQGHIQKISQLTKPLEPAYATASDTSGRPVIYAKTPKPNDSILMMKGDKGLPQGIKPSEKVEVRRSINAQAEVTHKIDVPEEVLKAAEKQGLDRVTAQEKLQQIAESIRDVHYRIGDYDSKIHGTERAYGNKFHEMLRENLEKMKASDGPNGSLIHPESSYLKGNQGKWGQLGTSRVDISLGKKDEPFASMCLKTLEAVPSAQQERGWVRNLPKLKDGSIPPRLYVKLPRAER